MWHSVKIEDKKVFKLKHNIILLTFSQVTEIVSKIKTKSELDCKARDIVTIEEGDMDYNAALDKFANILSGDPGSNPVRG